jgi:hypothetical protein
MSGKADIQDATLLCSLQFRLSWHTVVLTSLCCRALGLPYLAYMYCAPHLRHIHRLRTLHDEYCKTCMLYDMLKGY